ncbi:MAG: aminotransferase class I/II-fold pyridoxal phosphate-dependent enzyme [Gammaproteobacteria bacterium]|nr:aminotransferase class I/II-fold pyridoxal phosphate-dependent enzyme [Gammaproteobacteria bacterium]
MKFSSLVERVRGSTADVWDSHYEAVAARSRGEDIIVLSVGDPDFDTPRGVMDAAFNAMQAGDTHYTSIKGNEALRLCIAEKHQRSSGQSVDADNIIITSGGQNALFTATQCICEAGDEVIVLQPMYVTYQATIQAAGAKLVPLVLDAENRFSLDVNRLKDAITPHTRAIYFATPSNPTGITLRQNELAAISKLAIEHDLWVVADEVYCDFVFDNDFLHIGGMAGMAERTVTINSLSKSYAMTGWRVGWAIGPKQLIDNMEKLALCMLYGLPGFIQQAGLYALQHCAQERIAMRDIYQQRRDRLVKAFEAMPVLQPIKPDAGMFLMVDVRGTGLSATQFVRQLLDHVGVSVLDATAFGASAAGFVRVSYAASDELLDEALMRISRFVETRCM